MTDERADIRGIVKSIVPTYSFKGIPPLQNAGPGKTYTPRPTRLTFNALSYPPPVLQKARGLLQKTARIKPCPAQNCIFAPVLNRHYMSVVLTPHKSCKARREGFSLRISRHAVVYTAGVLALSGLALQFLGFAYRIVLSRMLGAEGMGVYQLVFPVISVVLALRVRGFIWLCHGFRRSIWRLTGKAAAPPPFDMPYGCF